MQNNHYKPQSDQLREFVQSIWQVNAAMSFSKEQILPKGVTEIIFNFSEPSPIPVQINGRTFQLGPCIINGYNIQPIQLELPARLHLFGIRLQPMAVKKLFKIPANKFSNELTDLTLVDSGISSLWHQLAAETSFEGMVSVFSKWIEKKITALDPRENMINDFLSQVQNREASVSTLAHKLCYSTRQLSRKMTEATGLNTEDLLLYKNYIHALHLMHHENLSLTQVAYECNFFDQSHFNRTFKSFANMTPGNYLLHKSQLAGHLYQDVR